MYFFSSNLGLFGTNDESARYLLSALIQSEAAIIALVITLSMVAVQLTASSYSPRVTDLFRKSPHLLILMLVYVFSIVYEVVTLKMVGEFANEKTQQVCVNFACNVGIYCFIILIPYTYEILDMLKPSIIVESLLQGMTKHSLLEEENPFREVNEILKKSISTDDYRAIRSYLMTTGRELNRIFQTESFDEVEEKKFAERIHMEIGKISNLLEELQDYPIEMIEILSAMTLEAIENNLRIIAQALVSKFGDVVKHTTGTRFIWVAAKLEISELSEIVRSAIKREFPMVSKGAVNRLREIAIHSLERYDHASVKENARLQLDAAKEVSHVFCEIKEIIRDEELFRLVKDYSDEIDYRVQKYEEN